VPTDMYWDVKSCVLKLTLGRRRGKEEKSFDLRRLINYSVADREAMLVAPCVAGSKKEVCSFRVEINE
jgi:hypothetical protein